MAKLWEGKPLFFDETIGQEEPTITPYLLDGGEVHPAVIVFPGGGYMGLADHEAGPIAEMFNQAGFHVFVVKYRLSPYRFEAILSDGLEAVRYVRKNAAVLCVDPKKIAVCGFSAGGHLACMVSELFDEPLGSGVSARPDAAVLCYPVLELGEETHFSTRETIVAYGDREERMQKYGPDKRVHAGMPPVFIWHTEADEAVLAGGTLRFCLAMQEANLPYELHMFPEGQHGLGLGNLEWAPCPHISQWASLAVNFLHMVFAKNS